MIFVFLTAKDGKKFWLNAKLILTIGRTANDELTYIEVAAQDSEGLVVYYVTETINQVMGQIPQ